VKLDVAADGNTARLQKLATGLRQAELIPAASAKTFVALAGSVRALVEAQERGLAADVLNDIELLAKSAADEAPRVAERIAHHVNACRKALR
jgi:hypothetical protein